MKKILLGLSLVLLVAVFASFSQKTIISEPNSACRRSKESQDPAVAEGYISEAESEFFKSNYLVVKSLCAAAILITEETDPSYFEAHLLRARANIKTGSIYTGLFYRYTIDLISAYRDIQIALQVNPDSALANHTMGVILNRLGETRTAGLYGIQQVFAEKALPFFEKALLLEQADSAYLDASAALATLSDLPRFFHNLGNVYLTLNEFSKAKGSAQAALEINEQHALGYSLLGEAEFKLRNYQEAAVALETAIGLLSTTGLLAFNAGNRDYLNDKRLAACYKHAADAYLALGDGVKAQEYFEKSNSLTPFIGLIEGNELETEISDLVWEIIGNNTP